MINDLYVVTTPERFTVVRTGDRSGTEGRGFRGQWRGAEDCRLRTRLPQALFAAFEGLVGGKIDRCRQCGSAAVLKAVLPGLPPLGVGCILGLTGRDRTNSRFNRGGRRMHRPRDRRRKPMSVETGGSD